MGQGTWQLRDKSSAAAALRLGLDLGVTHVDTAELPPLVERPPSARRHDARDGGNAVYEVKIRAAP